MHKHNWKCIDGQDVCTTCGKVDICLHEVER